MCCNSASRVSRGPRTADSYQPAAPCSTNGNGSICGLDGLANPLRPTVPFGGGAKGAAAPCGGRYSCSAASGQGLNYSPLDNDDDDLLLEPTTRDPAAVLGSGVMDWPEATRAGRNDWEGLSLRARRVAGLATGARDAAAAAAAGLGPGPAPSAPTGETNLSAHDCATAPTDCSELRPSSCFSQHPGWPTGDAAAAAAGWAAVPGDGDGDGDDGGDAGRGGTGDAEIRSLLRPGGSPCLPLEDGWELTTAALHLAAAAAVATAAAAAVPAPSPSDEVLRGTSRWLRGSLSISSIRNISSDSLEEFAGELNGTARGAGRGAPPPSSRHRACQFGYTDSAPAHGTAAAAATGVIGDDAVAFLRSPDGVAWRQVLGGTLSAPPAAVAAAAAAAARALCPLVESLSPASAQGLANPHPLAAAAMPPCDVGYSGECEARPVRHGFCGPSDGAPASASAAAAARSAGARSGAPRGSAAAKSQPVSAARASRLALTNAAAAAASAAAPPHGAPSGSSLQLTSAADASSLKASEGAASVGYFGSSLEFCVSSALQELVAGGCDADRSSAGGASWQHEGACCERPGGRGKERPADGVFAGISRRTAVGPASRAFGRLGRGLLGCFTAGH